MPDIDFDCQSNFDPKSLFDCVKASQIKDQKIIPHPCGVYFQNIPIDSKTNLSAIPYKDAEALGYDKVDFLHLSLLDGLTYDQLHMLRTKEPNWSLLQKEQFVKQLFHLGTTDQMGKLKHYPTLCKIKPMSLEEVADVLALIRPSKQNLIDQYRTNTKWIRTQLYQSSDEHYTFKRSHAFSYATNIVIQLNLLENNIKIKDNDYLQY